MVNHVEPSLITYDVTAICNGQEILLAEKITETSIKLPAGKSGKLRVTSYLNGTQQNVCTENFAAF
ncbi:hypothetical protein MSI_24350 [Treponema sp. JC4]|uniref:hypothetical protein n=1 Tax=Treponema sp. JC4 TaxID=1124982 RepID=UPI00025B0E7C|nr:hypothetical protein [Treponema sp. JC4]EID84120.1 hypothetical protein MSI_24350 [Treponema sp. JC4]